MKIRGDVLLVLVLWTPFAFAQGPIRQKAETAPPPSSGAFVLPSDEPAAPVPPPAPAPPAATGTPSAESTPPNPVPGDAAASGGDGGDGAPESANTQTAPAPRPARVIAAPSGERPDAGGADETPPDDDEDQLHRRGFHVHDGFYLRLALGAGYVVATSENDSKLKGWGIAPDIWIGGSPAPGLAIGVTFNGVSAPDPHIDATAADTGGLGPISGEASGTLTYSVFGLFADYYPDPTGGLHLMAGVNYSVMKFEADNGVESDPASGIGLAGGIGYEWWIGREWSVGPLARLHWASLSDAGATTTVLSPVFLLGFTNH